MSAPKAHAEYAASSASRWMNCPGSIALSKKAPPKGSSTYADEGTKAHSCLEDVIKGMKYASLKRKGYDEDMISYALAAWQMIESYLVRSDNGELLLEERVYPIGGLEDLCFGTLDCAVVELFGTLYVFDYKYGMGIPVEIENNLQMIFYAIGIAEKYDWNFIDVVITVIQPRAEHPKGPIRSQRMNIDTLKKWRNEFIVGIERTKNPKATIATGSWCRFCPAAAICPEVSKKAIVEAQVAFKETTGDLTLPPVEQIQIKHLGKMLNAFEKLDFWMSEVRAHALHVLERGEKIDGWKLVQKRSTRKWVDEEKVSKVAQKQFGEKVFKKEFLSPAQFEKHVDKDFVEKYAASTSSGTTIVHESDPRPEVNALKNAFGEPPE